MKHLMRDRNHCQHTHSRLWHNGDMRCVFQGVQGQRFGASCWNEGYGSQFAFGFREQVELFWGGIESFAARQLHLSPEWRNL
jgi:hypothetical protein